MWDALSVPFIVSWLEGISGSLIQTSLFGGMRLEGTSEIQAMGNWAEAHIPKFYVGERKLSSSSILTETFQTEKKRRYRTYFAFSFKYSFCYLTREHKNEKLFKWYLFLFTCRYFCITQLSSLQVSSETVLSRVYPCRLRWKLCLVWVKQSVRV